MTFKKVGGYDKRHFLDLFRDRNQVHYYHKGSACARAVGVPVELAGVYANRWLRGNREVKTEVDEKQLVAGRKKEHAVDFAWTAVWKLGYKSQLSIKYLELLTKWLGWGESVVQIGTVSGISLSQNIDKRVFNVINEVKQDVASVNAVENSEKVT